MGEGSAAAMRRWRSLQANDRLRNSAARLATASEINLRRTHGHSQTHSAIAETWLNNKVIAIFIDAFKLCGNMKINSIVRSFSFD